MRIGIITFHSAINYGAVLQCYALTNFLRRLGHEVEVIDYHRAQPRWRGLGERALSDYPFLVGRKICTLLTKGIEKKRRSVFAEFVAEEIPLTKRKYVGIEGLRNVPSDFDAYICGSDQIWNDRFWDGFNDAYFLAFGSEDALRIAYAPGVPGSTFKPDSMPRFRKLIRGIDVLSAREGIGQKLIEEAIGVVPPVVVDPTILFGEFADIVRPVRAPSAYVFSYGLASQEYVRPNIAQCGEIMKKKGSLPLLAVDFKNRLIANKRIYSPFEWLWLIKNSKQFVTNSYHGLVFALLFKKEFIVTPRDGRADGQDSRLLYLLERYHLTDRYITNTSQIEKVRPIDWGFVSSRISEDRAQSKAFLESALSRSSVVGSTTP